MWTIGLWEFSIKLGQASKFLMLSFLRTLFPNEQECACRAKTGCSELISQKSVFHLQSQGILTLFVTTEVMHSIVLLSRVSVANFLILILVSCWRKMCY